MILYGGPHCGKQDVCYLSRLWRCAVGDYANTVFAGIDWHKRIVNSLSDTTMTTEVNYPHGGTNVLKIQQNQAKRNYFGNSILRWSSCKVY